MKKTTILLLFCLQSSTFLFSQQFFNKWSIETLYSKDVYIGQLGSGYKNLKFNSLYYGQVGLGVNRIINPSFDVSGYLSGGFIEYNISNYKNNIEKEQDTVFVRKKIDLSFIGRYRFNNGYILPEDFIISPFLSLGLGATLWDTGFDTYNGSNKNNTSNVRLAFNMPIGIGLQYNITNSIGIIYNYHYVMNFYDNIDDIKKTNEQNIFNGSDNYNKHSIGLIFNILQFDKSDTNKLNYLWSIENFYSKDIYIGHLGSGYKNMKINQLFYGQSGIGLNRYLNKSFDANGSINMGFFEYKANNFHNGVSEITDTFFIRKKLDITLLGKYKFNNGYILPENFIVSPYVFLGVGGTIWDQSFDTYNGKPKEASSSNQFRLNIPIGFGVKYTIFNNVGVYYNFNYNLSFYDNIDGIKKTSAQNLFSSSDNYIKQSLGIFVGIVKSSSLSTFVDDDLDSDGIPNDVDECHETPFGVNVDEKGCPLDHDEDGVPNYLDQCVNTKKGAIVDEKGCPFDDDRDGIYDEFDKCPNTPRKVKVDSLGCPLDKDKDKDKDGVADYQDKCLETPKNVKVDSLGCPLDTDLDGVPDYQDSCPNIKGLNKYFGCVDSDNDSVPDNIDKCPTVIGKKTNKGCPDVEQKTNAVFQKALHGIKFAKEKDIILKSSFKILNQVSKILKNNPEYILIINGHTDNVGNYEKNIILSNQRANSVKKYLIKKNIPETRLKAIGYGDTRPIADNKTAKGKALNRRVELIVEF